MNTGRLAKVFALLAVGAAVALSAGGSAQAAGEDLAGKLGALEARSYVAWKAGDTAFFRTFLSDKFVGWGRSGRLDKRAAERVLGGAGCTIGSYRLADDQVTQLTPNAAVLTHRTEVDGACGGEPLAPAFYTATVFVREAGAWKAAFRAQSTIVDPMKAVRPAASDQSTGDATRADADTRTLLGREQGVWGAWKDHDAKRIDALIGDPVQFIDIFGDHLATRPEAIKTWSGESCIVQRFDLGGAEATMFSPDFGVLTFRATTEGKCFGQDVWPIWGTSLYVKRGGAWLWRFGINVLAGSTGSTTLSAASITSPASRARSSRNLAGMI